MPTVNLSSFAGAGSQFFDNSGVPLSGGLIYSYLAGTTTPLVTYTSSTGLTAHPNPIVLDSAGRINEVWVPEGTNCKFVLQTSTNVLIGTYDSLFPIASLPVSIYNGGTGATTAENARINLGLGTFLVPTGSIIMWPSNTSPTNWKLCNGDAISRVTFVNLFSLIGTTFGAGDGSTTFNLPNYKNKMPYGADTVAIGAAGGSTTITTNNLPSHTHTFSVSSTGSGTTSLGYAQIVDPGHVHMQTGETRLNTAGAVTWGGGAFDVGQVNTSSATTGITDSGHNHAFSVATSGSGTTAATGSGTDFLPPYLGINFIIKT